ncbi:TlpA family protein disulfide reductase [Sphingobacterium sp. SG20118]|uniref:TlpA family protein disulfide reductase n=1 Tax=Sphingobacterium sp. SG20118 TaxID=3367156 RepID=UPI0037DFC9B5
MKYLKLKVLLFAMLMLCVDVIHAQSGKKGDLSKALKAGDTFVPPSKLHHIRHAGKIDLKKLADKVVILDFFDTSCGTCIQSLPKLQKLQDKLKDKMEIVIVAWQDRATLEKFFDKNEFLKENKVNLPVIYSDLYLKEQFPHLTVPHVVLLYKGKVQAISGNKVVTEEHVLELFNKGKIDLPLKNDFGEGDLVGAAKGSRQIRGVVTLSGYQNGVPFQSFIRQQDSLTGLQKTSFYNVSNYSAVLFTWAKIKKADYVPRPERLLLNVKDPNQYEDTANVGDVWYAQHAISYERLDSIQRTDSAQARIVLQDLHSFLGIRSYKTMKYIECLILKPCPIKPYKGKVPLNGLIFEGSSVFAVMTDMGRQFPPVLDLVKSKVVIKLGKYRNLEELNEQLATYGIVATIGMGEQEVLVIEEVE